MSPPLEQRRQEAMQRYLDGEKVEDICRALSCSTSFLYRWRNRLNLADRNNGWEKGRSRRPVKSPLKTSGPILKEMVRLKETWSRNGQTACAIPFIQQTLKQQGIKPVPSRRTIYRILARHEKEVSESTAMP